MKKFVEINSNVNITVFGGLQSIDATNRRSPNADRLSIKPAWVGTAVDIKQGINYYPACVKEWDAVKSLAKDKVITIGSECDTCPNQDLVEALAKKLGYAEEKYKKDVARAKDDIAARTADSEE